VALVLVAFIVGTLATLLVPAIRTLALTYPAPSWWNGDTCDSTHFNASGQTAHLLTTWNGIQVCGYGPTQGGTDVAVTFPGGHGEYEWECTELVKRYLYIVYGAPAIDAYGYNLVNNYTSTYSSLFTKLANDGTNHIKVGDVLSYNEVVSGDHGHTVIVKDTSGLDGSGTGTITVIEENASSTGQHTQTVTNWVIKHGIDDGGSTDTVSYWLTPKESWSTYLTDTTSDDIYSTTATSPTSVWAAGYEKPTGSNRRPVTYYHDSAQWHKYMPPQYGSGDQYLYGIASSSSGDTWTVGQAYSYPHYVTLAYHWNSSTNSWTHVTSDSPNSSSDNTLNSVAIDSSGNVWAVGYYYNTQPLIEKWNGTKFAQQTISLPTGFTHTQLLSVAFSSSSNGWAVGQAYSSSTGWTYVIYHYDGSWTSTTGSSTANLTSVAVVSDSEVWAVGSQGSSSTPLILHYTSANGWQQDTSFNGYYPSGTTLRSVGTDGASDVWIVGEWSNGTYSLPYTMHYNGYYWAQFTTPTLSGYSYLIQGVAVNSGDAWIGGYYNYSVPSPVVFQYA